MVYSYEGYALSSSTSQRKKWSRLIGNNIVALTAFIGSVVCVVAAMGCFDLIVGRLHIENRELWAQLGRPGAFFSAIEDSIAWSGDASRRRLLWQLQLTGRHPWAKRLHVVCLRVFSIAAIAFGTLCWFTL
jgi:hypothetical protein